MAYKGQLWNNPETGDKVEVLETRKDNSGARLCYRFTVKPGGFKPALHIHEKQDKIFEIESGKLTYNLGGNLKVAARGETVVLPKGVPHTHYNGQTDEDLVMVQSIKPALDSEYLVDSILGLAKDGKLVNGQPEFMQATGLAALL